MEYVGVGRRAVAVIIDSLLLGAIGWILDPNAGQSGDGMVGFDLTGGPALLFFAIALGYFVVLEATTGATLGKMALGIRVVQADGSKLGWGGAVIRNLLRIVDGLFAYLVGAIVIWSTDKNQRVGDLAATTVVVRK